MCDAWLVFFFSMQCEFRLKSVKLKIVYSLKDKSSPMVNEKSRNNIFKFSLMLRLK